MEIKPENPVRMYCPNCQTRLLGYKNSNGIAKIRCRYCDTKVEANQINKHHIRLEIYAPYNLELFK